jgi:hypothetical protein
MLLQMPEEKKKNRAAVALGRRGGKMRAAKLSAEELSAQGKRAAAIRWEKSKPLKEEPMVALAPPEPIQPEAVSAPPEPVKRPEPRMEARDSNVILTLREQGYEVGEPAMHPDGLWRVNVRNRDYSAWVTTGEEVLDLAAGRLTLEAVMKRRQVEQRSAAAGASGR